jgi:hypothetical protein
LVIDADRAELINDHGAFVAVLLAENVIQQRRLPCAEKPVSTVTGIISLAVMSFILTQQRHKSEKFLQTWARGRPSPTALRLCASAPLR